MSKKKILITGSHRSGTTWLWQIFLAGNCLSALSEPLNKNGKFLNSINFDCWFPYLDPALPYTSVNSALDRLLSEKEKKPKSRLYNRIKKGKPFSLIKDPIGLFASEWYYQQYNTENVILIRHPAAFVFSIMRVNWWHAFEDFLPGKNLPPAVQEKFWDKIKKKSGKDDDIISNASLLWCVLYFYVSELFLKYKDNSRWHFVRHEDLSRDPENEIAILIKKLGLKQTRRQVNRIKELCYGKTQIDLNTEKVHVIKRDSKKMVKKWKEALTSDQIGKIREQSQEVSRHFYSDEDW